MGKRELVALLNLSSWCLVMVERLFLAVPRGCLRFVIVVFPDQTHYFFWGVGGLPAKHLLPCCCIHDSLLFYMQHGHVLKKFSFGLFTPSPRVVGEGGLRAK